MKDSAVNCNARVPDSPAQPCGISGWGFKDGGSRAMICLPLMPGGEPQEARGDVGSNRCQGFFRSVRETNPLSKKYPRAGMSECAR